MTMSVDISELQIFLDWLFMANYKIQVSLTPQSSTCSFSVLPKLHLQFSFLQLQILIKTKNIMLPAHDLNCTNMLSTPASYWPSHLHLNVLHRFRIEIGITATSDGSVHIFIAEQD